MAETIVQPKRPVHRVEIRHRVGTLQVDAAFTLMQPWTVLFGPSGSGKTTILRVVAGLMRPDEGRVVRTPTPETIELKQDEALLLDTAAGVFVPAHQRAIRMAPQQASLFPHLTVRENLVYGFRRPMQTEDTGAWENSVARAIEVFDLENLAEKMPRQLSGGESQRLNLARAWLAGGQLLLLDEPFTGFDAGQQGRILRFLLDDAERGHKTILSVTHDVAEAFQLNAEVIKIAEGKVVQQGPVEDVLAEERLRLLEQLSQAK